MKTIAVRLQWEDGTGITFRKCPEKNDWVELGWFRDKGGTRMKSIQFNIDAQILSLKPSFPPVETKELAPDIVDGLFDKFWQNEKRGAWHVLYSKEATKAALCWIWCAKLMKLPKDVTKSIAMRVCEMELGWFE